ncbi:MAG: pseudouridine synthase [Prevotellaceae bacterium]|jgi:23S rRNA pseudouridine2605 synthase|nr:pseudouridine synthase [Prevotellaceae bacterium]
MENNQEEPKVYRPRTGSVERKKNLSVASRSAENPTDGDEPNPRERKRTEEQSASRTPARQSFFKNRTPQSETHDDDDYIVKPRRASRATHSDGDERPRRASRAAYSDGDERPRRASRATSRSEDEKPRRRAAGRDAGERRKKSPGFDKFYKEKPRGERRTYDRDKAGEGRPYARKPYREEEPRSYRSKRTYDERREKPFGERRTYDRDRSEKPYARKPYGEKEAYGSRSAKPRAGRKPSREIQVKEPNMSVRLNKFISNSGVCSRREADEYIQNGEITVNGVVVTTLGTKVLLTDEICWNGEKLSGEKKVYIVLNKPKGYVTTVEDPHANKTVMDLIAGACSERVYPVGRLDKNTTGVLLFTNDGELTKTLTHPSYNKRKVYQATLDKTLKKPDMEQLVEGVELEDGIAVADEVGYTDMEDKSVVGLEIHSGRNLVVRRMFEALGYEVKKLDRVYFAGLTKKSLERGEWRFLSPKEVSMLKMGAYE